MKFAGEYRSRFEGYGGGSFRENSTDAYWLSRTRLSLTLQPVSWLRVTAEAQDSRAIGKQPGVPPYENVWDVHQAFADVGDFEKGRFSLRVGRQEFSYGDTRILSPSLWSNASRSFDAVRAVVRFDGVRVDVFAASAVVSVNDTWDHHPQGNNLHGVYSDFSKLIPHADIQPYFLWRLQPRIRNEAGIVANLNEGVPGLRWTGTLPKSFDYRMEITGEFGSLGTDRVRAWAGHWSLGHTWKSVRFSPRVFSEYDYLSGDANPRDGVRETFDQIYANLHDKFGVADQFAGRNLRDIRSALETKLPHGITANLEHNCWFLASPFDAIYTSQGNVIARSANGTAGTHLGNEIDMITTWKMRGPVQAGAGLGYIIPGAFLKNTTPGKAYLYPYIMFTYKL